jgi:uncharacterized protein
VIRYFVVRLSSRIIGLLPLVLLTSSLVAQVPPDVVMERAGYVDWLKKAPNSPLAAVAQQRLGDGVRLGPADSDIPLPGVEAHRVFLDGSAAMIEGPGGVRPISRGRPVTLGGYFLYLTGSHPGTVVTAFAKGSGRQPPGYYEYDPALVFTGPLLRPKTRGKVRVLAADGVEVEATEIGSFVVPLGGGVPLRVLRIPLGGGDESDLEIFFRDESNGDGTYPAGRFVSLLPLSNGQFRLDLNRARNPFCAYSSVYPCPAPWRGNTILAPIRAGERYAGGGLEAVPDDQLVK